MYYLVLHESKILYLKHKSEDFTEAENYKFELNE